MRLLYRLVASFLLFLLSSSCSEPAPSAGGSTFTLVPVARFGSVDNDLALRRVLGIRLSPGLTRLYVSQWQVPSILMLGRTGDSLGVIGRAGSGPGEFSNTVFPEWRGDTLWVADTDGTIVQFDTLGAFLGQYLLRLPPLGTNQIRPRPIAPMEDGLVLVKGSAGMVRVSTGLVTKLPFTLVNLAGEVVETVAVVSEAGSVWSLTWPDGSGTVGQSPWAFSTQWTVTPDPRRLLIVDQSGFSAENPFFRLTSVAMSGDTVSTGLIPSQLVAIEEAHIRAVLEERFSYRIEDGRSTLEGLIRTVREQAGIPPIHPPVASILASEDGSIWLSGPHPNPDSVSVTVLDGQDFGVLGKTTLPRNVQLHWASMKEVWASALGKWGESYILEFRPAWN